MGLKLQMTYYLVKNVSLVFVNDYVQFISIK